MVLNKLLEQSAVFLLVKIYGLAVTDQISSPGGGGRNRHGREKHQGSKETEAKKSNQT